MKKVEPKGEWVLLKRTKIVPGAGIVIPDQSEFGGVFNINKVIAIGDKVTRVKIGDEIVGNMAKAIKVDLPDPELEPDQVLIPEDGIMAILVPIIGASE